MGDRSKARSAAVRGLFPLLTIVALLGELIPPRCC